jgi:peptidoglycan hydrolase-like protein with peptidoglycan-binding domain
MRDALRRIAFGVLGTGMIAAMAAGTATPAASAAVSAPPHAAAASRPAALRWPVVRRGDHGSRVRTVQYLLNQHGARLTPDGDFRFPTELAVKNFQRRVGLHPDGVVGNATWMKLIVTVRHGSRGDAVRAVQAQLRYVYGYFYVHVDGVFGHKTDTAVRDFQHRFRLVPDGVVGPVTWNTLVVNDN